MNENLLVNSKTDILEFKRKHNLLVANGTIKASVSNIKSLSNDVINNLRCGDVVLKEDGSGKHAYLVSFKSNTGLCLTYCDASCVETQSYDKSGDNWVYNSEDKVNLFDLPNPSGQNGKVIQVGSDGKFQLTTIEGATPLYWHGIRIELSIDNVIKACLTLVIINNSSELINTLGKVFTAIMNFGDFAYVNVDGYMNVSNIYAAGVNMIGILPYLDKLYFQTYDNSFQHIVISKTPVEWETAFEGANVVDLCNQLL